MKRRSRHPDFEQILEQLRAQGFAVTASASAPDGMLVTKHGAGAVLVGRPGGAAFAVRPGWMVRSEVGLLLDRGYQKFIKISQYEIPASAAQLQAIHAFTEELKQVTGAISLYNESLGTTSDVYEYDRLQGREVETAAAAQPWELPGEH